jgi:cobalt-zinc-cadmium efflux system outer membrane protein
LGNIGIDIEKAVSAPEICLVDFYLGKERKMKKSKIIRAGEKTFGVILLLMLVFGLSGKSVSDNRLGIGEESTLSELLSYAAMNNPELKAAFYSWKSAIESVTGEKSLPDPKFTFSYFIREVETRVGPQQSKLGIMQMFPWFGKLKLKGDAAIKMVDSEKQKYEQEKLNLFYQVKKNYFDYYLVLQDISVLRDNINLLKSLESVVESRYRSGITSYADLIKIKIEQDKLEDQLRSAEELITPVKARLNAVLNRPAHAPLPFPEMDESLKLPLTKDQLQGRLRENNPELKALDFQADQARIAVRLARKNYLPDFSIGVDYIFTGNARMSGVEDSGKDPIMAMVQINLPIGISRIKSEIQRAKNDLSTVLEMGINRENALIADLDMAFYQFSDARKKISLFRERLFPRACQAMIVIEAAYKTGNTDILNLIDAQRTVLDFQLREKELGVHAALKLAELERITGMEF